MGAKNTIKSNSDIERLFKTGSKITTSNTIALMVATTSGRDQNGRVAFIAGKRLGTAPVRSKAKRRLREAARIAGIPIDGLDIVLIARPSTTQVKFEVLTKDVRMIAERALAAKSQVRTLAKGDK
jgi:ribonuclease P protein component